MWTGISSFFLGLVGVLMIFIILLQRGRGGGLAGAFGGAGGQSAFGTKAGDVFTKITICLALIWVTLAGVTGFAMRSDSKKLITSGSEAGSDVPVIGKPFGDDDAKTGDAKTEAPTDADACEGY